ncbi:MAG: hypothetical protein D6747_05125 [Chlorobiota bacterium]|nr:MAG: hypothetical protein D6747_05125 [Chlorobiota bacterium]
MARWVGALVIALACICGSARADCADFSDISGWKLIDSHTIVLYRGSCAAAILQVPWCWIFPTSRIQLLKTYMCPWDRIVVDGTVCVVTEITNL